jgi:hypothetical protein
MSVRANEKSRTNDTNLSFWEKNAIMKRKSNARLEAKNGRIQRIKAKACGFINRQRFKDALLFHLGGLDLMPTLAKGCWFSTGKSEELNLLVHNISKMIGKVNLCCFFFLFLIKSVSSLAES